MNPWECFGRTTYPVNVETKNKARHVAGWRNGSMKSRYRRFFVHCWHPVGTNHSVTMCSAARGRMEENNTTTGFLFFVFYSQIKGLVPFGVEVGADGFGLLLGLVFGVRDELELDVGIRQAVGVHRDQVSAFAHWWKDKDRDAHWLLKAFLHTQFMYTSLPDLEQMDSWAQRFINSMKTSKDFIHILCGFFFFFIPTQQQMFLSKMNKFIRFFRDQTASQNWRGVDLWAGTDRFVIRRTNMRSNKKLLFFSFYWGLI